MILEHAELSVTPGREDEFEAAFRSAAPIISATPGFRRLMLSRCVERENVFLLLVEWTRIEDHTEGFLGSPGYQEWRRLLHSFYDPFPVVEHFHPLFIVGPTAPGS
ncbi:antibiotic biosynthesis monooxygenase family protein [Blastococcus sp. SYSU DS0669]